MGNVLFHRRKVVAEELEELQKRGEKLEAQIRSSITAKQSVQWFSSLSMFFLTLASIAFSFVNITDKGLRTAYSIFSVLAGFILLYCLRRITNEYYNWSIHRKINAREEVAKRKRELLEKVKETETFKVAKEILEKYDDSPVLPDQARPRPSRQSILLNQPINTLEDSFLTPTAPANKKTMLNDSSVVDSSLINKDNDNKKLRKSDSGVTEEEVSILKENNSTATYNLHPRPVPTIVSPKPPRPFFKPSRSVAEKVVDFIIGDQPSDRYALICSHCHGHNGMARKEEFDFLSYRCWICGEFNPARRQRKLQLTHTQSEETLFSSAKETSDNLSKSTENAVEKDERCRVRTRSISNQPSSAEVIL
uniref:Endoplasmic reticulum junction formation protein lunapark n=1 Tax=Syphacia muris TaxID=451379 RepID=A0A158R5G3_9BILA